MQYTVREIRQGQVKVELEDGTELSVPVWDGITEAEFDDSVYKTSPASSSPSFLSVGASRTAVSAAEITQDDSIPPWKMDRLHEYGTLESQIEYITENGLAAWQTKVAQIKAKHPKIVE